MEHTSIIKAMLDLKLYTRYSTVLFKIENLPKEMILTLTTIKDYYSKYPEVERLSVDELRVYFKTLYPKYKSQDMMNNFFDQINKASLKNQELLKQALNKLAESHMVSQMITEGITYLEEEKPEPGVMDRISQRIEKFHELTGNIENAESRVCTMKFEELMDSDKSLGLTWRLDQLNRIIGPLKPASLGHIFARPEVGKSSMALAEATHFANQLRGTDKCILFLGNEEGMKRLKLRMHVAIIGQSIEWMHNANKREVGIVDEIYERAGGNHLKAIEGVSHINEVEMFINTFKPLVCFIDQGTKVNVSGSGDLASHEKLQIVYNIYRRLSTKYDMAIITTGQADSASEHKKWLTLNNMHGSKVGIPGELDWAVGITPSHEEGMERVRYINVCKNKLTGRLGKDRTFLDIEMCRYK